MVYLLLGLWMAAGRAAVVMDERDTQMWLIVSSWAASCDGRRMGEKLSDLPIDGCDEQGQEAHVLWSSDLPKVTPVPSGIRDGPAAIPLPGHGPKSCNNMRPGTVVDAGFYNRATS